MIQEAATVIALLINSTGPNAETTLRSVRRVANVRSTDGSPNDQPWQGRAEWLIRLYKIVRTLSAMPHRH